MPDVQQRSHNLSKQRLNIGLLGSPMHSQQGFWTGVADAAEANDVNLYVFLGGAVMTEVLKPTIRYGLIGIESAAVLYDLVDIEHMDGLVTWGGSGAGFGIHLNEKEMAAFFQRYHPLPIVNYEKVVDGIPTVMTDTTIGMRELLVHLIEKHGARRIALLRGPKNHFESEERHRAYKETLSDFGLPLRDDFVCSATGWDMTQGTDMMHLLMQERGLKAGIDFDAVVGTEGQYAVSAVRALQAQGIRVPDDVMVAGYNDNVEARATVPSITVMNKSFYAAGRQSLEILIDLIRGKSVPDVTLVPSDMIIRRSCGCWPETIQNIVSWTPLLSLDDVTLEAKNDIQSAKSQLKQHQETITDTLSRRLSDILPTKTAHQQANVLVKALFEDIAHDVEPSNHFISALEGALQLSSATDQSVTRWHSAVSTLRLYIRQHLADAPDVNNRIETIWQQARVIIAAEAQRIELENSQHTLLLTLTLREINRRLMNVFDMEELYEAIVEELPKLGIPSCYIALFDKPQPYKYPQLVPDWSYLVLAFDERGRVDLPSDGRKFRSRHLLPHDMDLPDRAATRVVVPLYVGQKQFGFALLETGPKQGTVYTELWQLMSNALQIVLLMKERFELALERERVQLLANFIQDVGHEFRTPLSIINTRLYLLNKQADSEKRIQHIEMLQDQSAYIQSLVDAMLTMSRLDTRETFAIVPVRIDRLLSEIETKLRPRADRKHITFMVELADDIPYIYGDRHKLFSALTHLVENAIQYTPAGGENTLRAYAQTDAVIVEIIDTGIGIAQAELPRIFERFYKVNEARTERGAGLGLSIARKIIESHQGYIEVTSTPEQGSTFKVVLPRSEV